MATSPLVRALELLLGSLVLPALVAYLVTRWKMNRQSREETQDWYDSVEAAASRIEGAWYRADELSEEKREDTIATVDSSLDDLKQLKGNHEASGKLVDSIEFLNRRWFQHKPEVRGLSEWKYGSVSDSIQRDCRQIKYMVEIDRPKSRVGKLKQKSRSLLNKKPLSEDTIEKLKLRMSTEEIEQVLNGDKTIRITKPFQSRLLVVPRMEETHFSVNAFPRILDRDTDTKFRKSYRIFLLCRIASLRRDDSVISVESEATDRFGIRNPPLHTCYGRYY